MQLLVIGKNGQLARALAVRSSTHPSLRCKFIGRPEVDLADRNLSDSIVRQGPADLIVNAAAYTQVDRAEEERDEAFALNAEAPGQIAAAAASINARLIHVSTDYVYDGTKTSAYAEEDPPNPQSAYGRSKLAGELAIRDTGARHMILRTAWVYSPHGANFVRTMLRLAESQNQLRVVDDQIGSPTSAYDLADAIFAVAENWQGDSEYQNIYHCAGSGQTSWCGLARHIFAVSRKLGGPFAEVEAIMGSQWPTAAKRPDNSVLNSSRFTDRFGYRNPEWQDSVTQTVTEILSRPDTEL
ncbi:MAG: dTDP-4-dehydrorhamnose reductase [Pseudomonadota bacterium]